MKTEMAFGLALKELRRERGLSQEELAAKSDLHRTYISLLERGQKSPSLTTICRLAKALDTQPHRLVLTTEEIEKSCEEK
jgi:transcriptional regulator with XRE-family HTH domain